jgi:CRP-like cAMP-binding protein
MAIRLMDAMDPRTEKALLAETVQRKLQRHTWLFHEGDRTDDVYLVVSGLLKLMKTAADGGEAVLAIRGAGDVVGELSAIDARPRLVSAVTMTETSVLPICRDRFVELMHERTDLTFVLLSHLSAQLRLVALHALAISSGDARALVARRLYQLASDAAFEPIRSQQRGMVVVDMPVSQRELATWAGVSHRSAVGAIGQLRHDEIIATSRLKLQILDMAGLRSCAGSLVSIDPR